VERRNDEPYQKPRDITREYWGMDLSKNSPAALEFDNSSDSENICMSMTDATIPDELPDPQEVYSRRNGASSISNSSSIDQRQGFSSDYYYPNPAIIPPVPRHSMDHLFRVLGTWPSMIARGIQLPPIFHPFQMLQDPLPQPLLRCFALVKTWYEQNESSSRLIGAAVRAEIKLIFDTVSHLVRQSIL
jgi:hypothetical protein